MTTTIKALNAAEEALYQQQLKDWPKHLAGAKAGNPWATLCLHCFGRHPPPNWQICRRNPPTLGNGGAEYDKRKQQSPTGEGEGV